MTERAPHFPDASLGTDLAQAAPPRRGRPPGKKMSIEVEQLRLSHFSYLRALILGVELNKAWDLFNLEYGPNDLRFRAARTRQLLELVRETARGRGMEGTADVALAGLDALVPRPGQALPGVLELPTLDDWISQVCEAQALDRDVRSEREWLEEYRLEFALDQDAPALPATSGSLAPSPPLPAGGAIATLPSTDARVAALNVLATAMGMPVTLNDPLGVWLTPELTKRLASTTVNGRLLPLITVGNLISMINLYHFRWWTHVPRLGAERAARVVAWLKPLAAKLNEPLRDISTKPLNQLTLERRAQLARLDPESTKRFGLVPLDRLAVPPELSGRYGLFRGAEVNTLKADDDLAAIRAWLSNYGGKSPRTLRSYSLIVERFYLWCVLVKRMPMSSLGSREFKEYEAFLVKPPADWVQSRRAGRDTGEWRPFKAGLTESSIKLNYTVIASLIASLHDAGYLRANGMRIVAKGLKRVAHKMDIDRSFNDGQWAWIIKCWGEMYARPGPAHADGEAQQLLPTDSHPDQSFLRAAELRRTRLMLELGATTGLRLIEFVTTRRRAVVNELVEGEPVWLMKVLGKGSKLREVVIYDDVKELLDQHHRDMVRAGTHFDATSRKVRTLMNPTAAAEDEVADESALPSPSLRGTFDPMDLPLIGALRAAIRARVLDANGLLVKDDKSPKNADKNGSMDPTAMYQSLKRFLAACCKSARAAGADIDVARLERASTHWMRHFFANSAVNDKVDLPALRDAMGHSSLQTTSVYVRTERNRIVSEFSKMKRRG